MLAHCRNHQINLAIPKSALSTPTLATARCERIVGDMVPNREHPMPTTRRRATTAAVGAAGETIARTGGVDARLAQTALVHPPGCTGPSRRDTDQAQRRRPIGPTATPPEHPTDRAADRHPTPTRSTPATGSASVDGGDVPLPVGEHGQRGRIRRSSASVYRTEDGRASLGTQSRLRQSMRAFRRVPRGLASGNNGRRLDGHPRRRRRAGQRQRRPGWWRGRRSPLPTCPTRRRLRCRSRR